MREQVWFIVSKTNERRYATTRPPAGEWEEKLRKEGYEIFRIEFDMPWEWDDSKRIEGKSSVAVDPRPKCVKCEKLWVPAEGVDATLTPCLSCQMVGSLRELIELVLRR